MKLLAIALVIVASACASVPPAGIPVTGEWGGNHIGMILDESGGRIEYDCADGIIGPIVPDAAGRISAAGTHTPGSGGPDIEGHVPPAYAAQFTGAVRGDRMTLEGRVQNGVSLGPFELRRGVEPGIFRCL